MLTLLSKLIPVSIQIKTLYWRRKEQEMDWDLEVIGNYIDEECYEIAETLIYGFRKKWESQVMPWWLSEKTAKVSRLEAINEMLKGTFDDEE